MIRIVWFVITVHLQAHKMAIQALINIFAEWNSSGDGDGWLGVEKMWLLPPWFDYPLTHVAEAMRESGCHQVAVVRECHIWCQWCE